VGEKVNAMRVVTSTEALSKALAQLNPLGPPTATFIKRSANAIQSSPSSAEWRVGVFSSSFNPFTIAHAHMCSEASLKFGFDELLLLINKQNADKPIFGTSLEQRLQMMEFIDAPELFAGCEAVKIPEITVGVSSHGLFVDQLHALQKLFPETTKFSFILGYDTVSRLFNPSFYKSRTVHETMSDLFLPCCSVIAFNRETTSITTESNATTTISSSMDELQQFLTQPEVQPFAHAIHMIESSNPVVLSASSTLVRANIASGDETLKALGMQLMPPSIAQHVAEHNLYSVSTI